jgi:UDP-glucose 6-dehydrogenase
MRVVICGTGYVGFVTGLCLADQGHSCLEQMMKFAAARQYELYAQYDVPKLRMSTRAAKLGRYANYCPLAAQISVWQSDVFLEDQKSRLAV